MFKTYKRTNTSEMRHISTEEYANGPQRLIDQGISISKADIDAGSPTLEDMIARSLTNPKDQWLVNKQYFEDNFEEV